ncbi:RDD family protein [Sulfurimonas sp. MAG313]|nr:RDD family protein [Sulfurimonas sp. MAG313]MDF1880431.1 RDD family protein [Sulfurimonas sp. MAG313]
MARFRDVKKTKVKVKETTKDTVYYAGFWSRFLALSVDIFMIGIPISILIYLSFGYETMQNQPGFMDAIEGLSPNQEANPFIPLMTMSLWSLITLVFWIKTGQTPGKKMAHIKIVNTQNYQQASPIQLLTRLIFFIMPIFAFLSLFVMLFHPKKRTLHDMISGTSVIYKR